MQKKSSYIREGIAQDFELNTDSLVKGSKEGVQYTISSVPGKQGRALRIDCDIPNPPGHCEVSTPLNIQPQTGGKYTFYLRGDCQRYVLEYKFVDQDETTFITKVSLKDVAPDKWIKKEVDFDLMRYAWGGQNRTLDGEIRQVIAISSLEGGKGYLEIDELTYQQTDLKAEFNFSQIGYHPEDKKNIILRLRSARMKRTKLPQQMDFSIISIDSGKTVLTETLTRSDFQDWQGIFYKGDFSKLAQKGQYKVQLSFDYDTETIKLTSHTFSIDDHVYAKKIAWAEWEFLKRMRCNENCHMQDPVLYGYHDTLDDIGKRMWSHPHLIYGIASFAEISPIQQNKIETNDMPDSVQALIWGVKYCINMTTADGSVPWGGVAHRMEWNDYASKVLPIIDLSQDHYPRYLDTDKSVLATAYNAAGLLQAARVLKKYAPELAEQALDTAKKNWTYIKWRTLLKSSDLGGFLYAATAFYNFTGDEQYLEDLEDEIEKLLTYQYNYYKTIEDRICGDFISSPSEKDFRYSYKMCIHNNALYLSLIELCKHLDIKHNSWWDVYYAAKIFTENYLLPMAAKTPYQQIAMGLEPQGNRWKVVYFSGDLKGSRAVAAQTHGLNCDHYAYALIAMKWAQYANDLRFEEFADNQFQWVVGQNPLGFSMISGVGEKQPSVIMSAYNGKGPINGGIPNGIMNYDGMQPEWWGDGASSGEYWLPHNSYLLAVMPVLDAKAQVSGTVQESQKQTAHAEIIIFNDNKEIQKLKTDQKGQFGPVILTPQKTYTLHIQSGNRKIIKNISLVSGDKEEMKIDLDRDLELVLSLPEKVSSGEELETSLIVKNKGSKAQTLPLKIFIRGAEIKTEQEQQISIKPGETQTIPVKLIPQGDIPLLIRAQDMDDKNNYSEVFRLPL